MEGLDEERITLKVRNSFRALLEVFSEMYEITDEFKRRKSLQFENHLEELTEIMLKDVEMKKVKMEEEVEQKLIALSATYKALGIPYVEPELVGPLATKIAELDRLLEEIKDLKEQRENRLEELSQKVKHLAEILDIRPRKLTPKSLTKDEIDEFENEVFVLSEEKVRRQDILRAEHKTILELWHELDSLPSSEFECHLFNTKEDALPLTQESLDKVHQLLDRVKSEHKKFKDDFDKMSQNLDSMWKKIDADQDHITTFKRSLKGIGARTLARMKDELKRCNEIRHARLEPLLELQRRKIVQLWENLTFTEDERRDFHSFFVPDVSEEVLELHEKESERLEALYQERREILQLAQKRCDMWTRRRELEDAACDKSRLNNRGGQLLQEEKERKSIEINLPKVEQKLKNLIEHYEDNGQTFTWHGKNLLIEIDNEWESYKLEKEMKKQKRKIAHDKTLVLEARLGTKRKMDSGLSDASKKLRATSTHDIHLPSSRSGTFIKEEKRKPLTNLNTPIKSDTPSKHGSRTPVRTPITSSPRTPRLLMSGLRAPQSLFKMDI